MIVSTDTRSPAPRWLRAATWAAVLCALPFGLIYCDRAEPTETDEETAAESVVPDAAQESQEPADTDLEELLSIREEEIRRDILQEVESGALSAIQGRELSVYVAGAKAGLLISYGGRELSDAEKQAIAGRLSESVNRTNLPDGIAMRDTLINLELLRAEMKAHGEVLQRATRLLERSRLPILKKRPFPPLIRRLPSRA